MSNQNQNPGALIGELLGALLSGAKVEFERVEVADDETVEQALQRAMENRDKDAPCSCMRCVARREAEVSAKVDAKFPPKAEAMEAEVEAKRKAYEAERTAAPASGKVLVGYMAFHEARNGTEPVFESFAKTYDEVEQARDKFLSNPLIQLTKAMMGSKAPQIIIRPVYADL